MKGRIGTIALLAVGAGQGGRRRRAALFVAATFDPDQRNRLILVNAKASAARGNMQWTEQTTDGLVLAVVIVVGLLIVREFYERQIRRYDVNRRISRKRKKP